jgi:DNA polymerase III subunit gamma/tau
MIPLVARSVVVVCFGELRQVGNEATVTFTTRYCKLSYFFNQPHSWAQNTMSYKVLARKWRPQRFEDVYGQKFIVRTLQQAIKNNRIGQAYIFAGTRGVGKTTLARIFAKSIRCENITENLEACGSCLSCKDSEGPESLNVVEIDGASNNSVDNIRDLIDNVHYLPTTGKRKIYIIDEVHMLSTSAFNALLKTLEEPPEHIIFIFATTEPDKLMATVLSRCQRFDFLNATMPELKQLVADILNEEKINYSSEDLIDSLCEEGKGSFRDTLSLLDQVLTYSSGGEITETVLMKALGIARKGVIEELLLNIINGEMEELSSTYHGLLNENISVEKIARSLLDELFSMIQSQNKSATADIAELYWMFEVFSNDFAWALEGLMPHKMLEIVLQKVTLRKTLFNSREKSSSEDDVNLKKKVQNITPSIVEATEVESETLTISSVILENAKANEEVHSLEEQVEEVKETEVAEVLPEVAVVESEKIEKNLTWKGFLEHLGTISLAQAANLEQGNIIRDIDLSQETLCVELGFSPSSKLFYEYLNTKDVKANLAKVLSEFFDRSQEQVMLNLVFLEEKAELENFQSLADIRNQEIEDEKLRLKDQMMNHSLIVEAQKLFNTRVDKVILNS